MSIEFKEMGVGLRVIRNYLLFVFTGAVIIGNICYVVINNTSDNFLNYWNVIYNFFNYITANLLRIIVFSIIAYVFGYFFKMLVLQIPLTRSRKVLDSTLKTTYEGFVIISPKYNKKKYKPFVDEIIKNDDHVHTTQTIGSAFFISALIFGVSFALSLKDFDLVFAVILFVFYVLSEVVNRESVKLLDTCYEMFVETVKGEKQNSIWRRVNEYI